MKANSLLVGLAMGFVALSTSALTAPATEDTTADESPVVMVCKKGTVKSVIATELFNREALERGLPFRAVSRGITPADAIPDPIAVALEGDAFDVSHFSAQKLTGDDITSAMRIVAIDSDLDQWVEEHDSAARLVQWKDIPPASVNYEASRDAMLALVTTLLDRLEAESSGEPQ